VLEGLADWWDTVELWLAQLWFPLQFALVVVVLAPVCLGIAWLIDRVVGRLSTGFGSGRDEDPSSHP
jgi:hypothetical protein